MRLVLFAAAALLLSAGAAAQPACTGSGCTTEVTTMLARLNELMAERMIDRALTYDSSTGHLSHTHSLAGTTRFLGADVEILNENPTVKARCRDGSECMELLDHAFEGLRMPDVTLYQAVQAPGRNDPVPRVDEIARLLQDLVARSRRLAGSQDGVASPVAAPATTRPPGCRGEHRTGVTVPVSGGGFYTGDTCGGLAHGQGSMTFGNGNRYTGTWVEGVKVGQGTFTFATGGVYVGAMANDEFEGTGRLTYPSGNVYQGQFVNSKPHGNGTMTYASGNRYTGTWVEGLKVGQGTFTYADGGVYVGEMANDRIEGTGRLEYANGEVYEGQFVDWKREGTGTLTIPDGGLYEGEWNNDKSHGTGRMTLANGSVFEGTYVDGRLHGPGRFTDAGGTTYVGTFAEGQMGEGVLTAPGQAPRRVRWNGERLETIGSADSPAPAPAPRPAPVAPQPAPARSAVDASAPPSPPAFGAYRAAIARAQTPDAHRDAFVAYAGAMTAAGVGAERIQAELARQLEALLRFDFDSGFAAYIYIPTDHFVGVRDRIDRTLNRCVLQRSRWTTASYTARQEGRTPDPRPVTECEGGPPTGPAPRPAPQVATPRPPGCTGEHRSEATLEWAAGTYTGETCGGRPHGQGSIAFNNGNRYAGAWVDGRKHGQGTYRYASGDVYVGQMTDDRIEGTGRLTYTSGNVYEGALVNGQKSGQGTFRYADGGVYVGEMANDRIEGTGRLVYANGNVYEGQFVNWNREGTGTLTYASGDTFEGTFVDNSPVEGRLTKVGAPPRPVRWTGTRFEYTDGEAPRPSRPAPGCGALVVDLDAGTLNGVAPTASIDAITAQFPCATGETEEGGPYNFGGGLFFINHDFYFYTHRDFLELRREFRGTTQPALLGRPLASSGLPAAARTDGDTRLYDKRFGCLRVVTDDEGVITELGVHATPCATLIIPR